MNPLDFDGAIYFGKPPGWDEQKHGKCATLPIRKWEKADDVLISYWKPDDYQLARLIAGKPVRVAMVGIVVPISITVGDDGVKFTKVVEWPE